MRIIRSPGRPSSETDCAPVNGQGIRRRGLGLARKELQVGNFMKKYRGGCNTRKGASGVKPFAVAAFRFRASSVENVERVTEMWFGNHSIAGGIDFVLKYGSVFFMAIRLRGRIYLSDRIYMVYQTFI